MTVVTGIPAPVTIMSMPDMALVSDRVRELLVMHTYKRPASSNTERLFIHRYLTPLGVAQDGCGNLWLDVGTDSPSILWSSHTDTVHRSDGMQRVEYGDGILTLGGSKKHRECLGADCTAGVWIMRQMILAGVPGRYVFHRGEEIGGIGSSYVAKSEPVRLKGIQFAIAFDRRGTQDVISHQFTRTASDKFCGQMSELLGMGYTPDDTGTFTDTANYEGMVPECTNLSVGYERAHSSLEFLSVDHVTRLLDKVLAVDWSVLVAHRDPAAWEDRRMAGGSSYYGGGGSQDNSGGWYKGADGVWRNYASKATTVIGNSDGGKYRRAAVDPTVNLSEFCRRYPEAVAEFLTECGYDLDDMERYVDACYTQDFANDSAIGGD